MYIESWQLFLLSASVGILFTIIGAVIISLCLYKKWFKEKQKAAETDSNNALITKLCFVLLAKGLISDSDRDWMLDKIEFSEWKKAIEDELNDKDGWFS